MTPAPLRRLPESLATEVRAWIAEDPDPATRAELIALVEAGDVTALQERFAEPLSFGTAGLRGALGAGPARMNRLVVRRTTAGVARWLLAKGDEAPAAGLVVGRDARHGSSIFAADVVEVATAMGVRVLVLPQPLPTPLTAFAVLHYGAAAGVMITASHNPAPDNGYKVYAADGAQIVPPDDELIAAGATAEALASALAPARGGRLAPAPARPAGLVTPVDRDELLEAYAAAALGVLEPDAARELSVVYTPVHGVGGEVLPWLFGRAGFARPHPVSEQADPDPDFPTAPFPNPEEPGVLDLALAEAARIGADIVIANDPDADRLAVALPIPRGAPEPSGAPESRGSPESCSPRESHGAPEPSGAPGPAAGWRVLTGDELGALLGSYLLEQRRDRHRGASVVASSIVSSSLLGEIAAAAGVHFVETLTGFKWIARAADHVPGGRLVFGYEEALGYAVSPAVRDKDGLSAALLLAELAARARAAGRPLVTAFDELDRRFGVHLTSQWSLRLAGPGAHKDLLAIVDRWRRQPPRHLGGFDVVEAVDLERGAGGLPRTAGVLLRLAAAGSAVTGASGGADAEGSSGAGGTGGADADSEGGAGTEGGAGIAGAAPARGASGRVVVRPSGTEPKLKAYLEVVLPAAAAATAGGDAGRAGSDNLSDELDAVLAGDRQLAGQLMARLRADVGAALAP